MKRVKVSVIIPVYNTERYVREAIESICAQSLQETEIIIINDGSTDGSLPILKALKESDPRIRLFSQKNQGQASARNFGLKKAQGEYVYFMDSDDRLVSEALDECFHKAEKEKLDFVFFDADTFTETDSERLLYDYHRCQELTDEILSGPQYMRQLFQIKGFKVAPWLQMIRREFLNQHQLRFTKTIHEDELFTHLLFLKAQRVGFIRKAYFQRRLRPGSVMTQPFTRKNWEAYLFICKQINRLSLSESSDSEEIKELVFRSIQRILDGMMYRARSLPYHERLLIALRVTQHYFGRANKRFLVALLLPLTSPK